jgi:hypothetical protein
MEYKIVEHESLLEINKYSKLVTWNWNSCLKYACVYKRADAKKLLMIESWPISEEMESSTQS